MYQIICVVFFVFIFVFFVSLTLVVCRKEGRPVWKIPLLHCPYIYSWSFAGPLAKPGKPGNGH